MMSCIKGTVGRSIRVGAAWPGAVRIELELLTHLRHQLWKPRLLVGQNPFPFTVLLARFRILYKGSREGCRLIPAIFSESTSHLATPLLRKFIYIITLTFNHTPTVSTRNSYALSFLIVPYNGTLL